MSSRRSEPDTLLVIIGMERDENATPFVLGAFNEEYLHQLPLEDCDKQLQTLKKTWTGDPNDYEWRTARVRLDLEDLAEMFTVPEVNGYWE